MDGLTGSESSSFIKRLASGLAVRWEKSSSNILGWVRARLGLALAKATVWLMYPLEKLGFEDGAAI